MERWHVLKSRWGRGRFASFVGVDGGSIREFDGADFAREEIVGLAYDGVPSGGGVRRSVRSQRRWTLVSAMTIIVMLSDEIESSKI